MVNRVLVGAGLMLGVILCLTLVLGKLVPDRQVVLHGMVEVRSIHHQTAGQLVFKIRQQDGQEATVVYSGPWPKGFQDTAQVAIAGQYSIEGVFLARQIWVYTLPTK